MNSIHSQRSGQLYLSPGFKKGRRLAVFIVPAVVLLVCLSLVWSVLHRDLMRRSEGEVVAVCRQTSTRLLETGLKSGGLENYLKLIKKKVPELSFLKVMIGYEEVFVKGKKSLSGAQKKALEENASILHFGRMARFTLGGLQYYWLTLKKIGGRNLSLLFGFYRTGMVDASFLFVVVVLFGLFLLLLFYLIKRKKELRFHLLLFFLGIVFSLIADFYLQEKKQIFRGRNIDFANRSMDLLKQNRLIFGGQEFISVVKSFNAASSERSLPWCSAVKGAKELYRVRSSWQSQIAFHGESIFLLLFGLALAIFLGIACFKILVNGVGGILVVGKWFSLLALFLFCVLPVVWLVVVSFLPEKEAARLVSFFTEGRYLVSWRISFDNYLKVLNGPFLRYFSNSLFVSVLTAFFAGTFSILPGYAFSRFRFAGKRPLLRLLFSFRFFPTVMMAIPFYIIAKVFGFSQGLGLLVLIYAIIAIPFAVWMMKRCFDMIPVELEDIASIAGASVLARIWHVLLPLARKGIAATFFYTFLIGWNEFMFASFFIKQPVLKTLPVAIYEMTVDGNFSYSLFAAAAVLSSLPVLYIFWKLYRNLAVGLSSYEVSLGEEAQ